MSSNSTASNNDNSDDIIDGNQETQIPRRGRTPSIIVQSLNLNPQGGTSITESIELLGDDDLSHGSNSSGTSDPRSSLSNVNEEKFPKNPSIGGGSIGSTQGSSSSLYNPDSSPLRNIKSPLDYSPKLPNVSGNRRLSLTIGTTAPRRLSLNVDNLPGFVNSDNKESPVTTPGNATGSLRNKVALKPGHSLMGWIHFTSKAKDLSGTNGKQIEVTPDELAKHNKQEDCWVALKDKVYNVTTYLQYHPGGVDELMRGAGRDATELFNEVHQWVNYESILAKCLVGPFKQD